MTALLYHCPHCGATHEIAEPLVGDRIDCRKCGRLFEAAVPVARPETDGDSTAAEFQVAAGEGEIEDVILEVHPSLLRRHPFQTIGAGIAIVIGICLLFAGLGGVAWLGAPALALTVAGAVLAAVGGIAILYWWVQTRFTMLKITNRRSMLRKGWLSRETTEVRHRDVRNLQLHQNWFGRLMGVGDIAISSSGQDGLEIVVRGIPNPQKVADIVRDMQE